MKRGTIFTLAAILLVTPIIAAAAGLVPCGGDGEPACQACYVVTLMNNVIGWLVTVLTAVVAIVFVVSGLKLVTSAGNPAVMEAAKKTITNTFIGFVIILAAWLLVDFGMKALLNGGVGNVGAGPWNSIQCTKQPVADAIPAIRTAVDAIAVFGAASAEALAAASVSDVADCTPTNLQAYGFTAVQSQVMSCIAGPESGCNNNADASENGLGSSARGVFQIVYGYSDACHSLRLPECTAANGGVPLNCGKSDDYPGSPCNKAASNFACNAAAARCLLNGEASGVAAGYQHWTADRRASKQSACIQRYAS